MKIMMDRLNIPSWEWPGFEADDLIASLAKRAKQKKWEIYIVSGDKDFAQIVDSSTYLYDTMRDIIYDPAGVEEKWGIPPSQMLDFLSLTGDSSDNIPGVRGIGPKGAAQLLKSHKSLEGIYKSAEQLKGSLREKILKGKDQAFLFRKLIALKSDIVWERDLEEARHQKISDFSAESKQALKEFLEELSFKSFLKTFFSSKTESPRPLKEGWVEKGSKGARGASTGSNPKNKHTAETAAQGGAFPQSQSEKKTKEIQAVPSDSLKIKQISLEELKKNLPPYAELWLGSFKDQRYLASGKNFVLLESFEGLADFLDYKRVRYAGHDLKFFWRRLKIKKPVAEWDSLIAGHLSHSLAEPSFRKLLNMEFHIPEEEELSLPQTVYQERLLRQSLSQRLKREEMSALYQDIELPLIAVLYDMERQGALLDLKELEKQSKAVNRDIQNLEFQIHKLAGMEFNLSSPKQLAEILFERLKLPRGRKTKTGYSTDSHELMKIKSLHPILPLVLERRELFKLKSAYIDNLISLRDEKTGRAHTEFKQAVTSTGRLSSVNPNLQNIPIRGERGQLIRKAFIAGPEKKLVSADYSQIELRILAHITGDPNLCKAFNEDLDIHAMTASELFNVPLSGVSSDLRRKSKAVNFGIAYGQGVYGLAESLSIPRAEAKEIIENYFRKFKRIKDYIEAVKEDLPKKNYVKTLYGRKRFFRAEDLNHPRFRSGFERAAINAPLQGTASDLVKKAMIDLSESLPIPIISQVHDELLFECPEDSLKRESGEIISLMEKNDILKVPLKVNLSSGKNWFMAHS